MEIITAAMALWGTAVTAALPPLSFVDPAWAIPLNTLLWIVLAIMNKRTQKTAERAAKHAETAVEVSADTRRAVKEAHNATLNAMELRTQQVLAKKYEDRPDPDTGRFEPREKENE